MSAAPDPLVGALTARECEVVALLVDGVTTDRALAGRLMVTVNTVHYHVAAVMRKLDCNSRAGIVAYAWCHGLVVGSETSALNSQPRA